MFYGSKYWSLFSCVSKDVCNLSKRGTTNIRETTLEIQKALAEEAECPNQDDAVCCNENDIEDQEFCSDFEEDGYRYARQKQLTGWPITECFIKFWS